MLKDKHKALHHLSQRSEHHGWVESIESLTEDTPATDLLINGSARHSAGHSRHPVDARPGAAEPPPRPSAGPRVSAGCDDEFQARVEHALDFMREEVTSVGEAVLAVGAGWGPISLGDEQLKALLARLSREAGAAGADVTVLRERAAGPKGADGGAAADVLVRRRAGAGCAMEVRVAVIGNVDSGKSTLVGVLTRAMLDDGRGLARSKVFVHGHEEATGRTSSIGQHNLCLDSKGGIVNDALFRSTTCADYIARASKVVTLVDLAGHERYFKTTAYGLTGHLPDYACLIVGANAGIVGMCKEHLGVALALKVPVFFVVTKVDICPAHILEHTLAGLTAILRKPGVKKKPFMVRGRDDALTCARHMHTDAVSPIFLCSSVTGAGLDLVRLFYNLLPQRHRWAEKLKEATEFLIDETFGVPGVGTVVAGTVKRGIICQGSQLLLGPDLGDASFKPTAIKSVHYKRLQVHKVVAGQTAALALKRVRRGAVRKGMVLVDASVAPVASWEFDADIAILTHSTTIQPRYQAVIHCEIVRQAARVVAMDCERLRSGDRACVRFRFLQRPEYLTPGTRFVFREGRTKGIGMVVGPR